jgi:hypothetical protein
MSINWPTAYFDQLTMMEIASLCDRIQQQLDSFFVFETVRGHDRWAGIALWSFRYGCNMNGRHVGAADGRRCWIIDRRQVLEVAILAINVASGVSEGLLGAPGWAV